MEEEERQVEGTEAVQAPEYIPEHTPEYTWEQLINTERYAGYADLIGALLQEDQTYPIKEVDQLIQRYLKKEVK